MVTETTKAPREIIRVKVWVERGETRVYVNTTGGGDGCRYVTGNKYNAKGSVTGTLTPEEWAEARRQHCIDGRWQTWYKPDDRADRPNRCPDCGELEGLRSGCGGGNCGANRGR